MGVTLVSCDDALAPYYITDSRNRLMDSFTVSCILHIPIHQSHPACTKRNYQKHTMKATIVIVALIQGLALATPVIMGQTSSAMTKTGQAITAPAKIAVAMYNSKLSSEVDNSKGGISDDKDLDAKSRGRLRTHQRHNLPDQCWKDNRMTILCREIYRECQKKYLPSSYLKQTPSKEQAWKFEKCIKELTKPAGL